MTDQPAVAVLGERVVDLVPDAAPDLLRVVPGGSPANVAVGLARLGIRPVLLARAGDDGFSRVLDRHLVDSGLGLDGVVHAGGPSAMAVVERQPDGSAHYDLYLRDVPDLSWTPQDLDLALAAADRLGAVCWHTGSLASWSGPGWAAVLDAWRAAHDAGRLTLSYDPNARPGEEPLPEVARRVEAYVRLSDVVKVSDEDLARLYPDRAAEEVCQAWAQAGPALVVLTRGPHGVSAWRAGRERIDVPGVPVVVSDTVGAGDTLTAGLLAGLADAGAYEPRAQGRLAALADDALADLLARACRAAAITCSRPGADPPTRAELDAWSPA